MKLCIFTDDGELHEVVEDIDEYDLTKGIGAQEIINQLVRAILRAKAPARADSSSSIV